MGQDLVTSSPPQLPSTLHLRSVGDESFEQLLYVLFKRKRLILGFLLSFMIAAALVLIAKPPVRTAVAKILLKPDRVSMQISGLSPESAKWPYSSQVLQSELEMIESRDVMMPVAKDVLAREGKPVTPERQEARIRTLVESLVPVTLKNTSVIELTYFGPTSEDAEWTLSRILEEYLRQHTAVYSGSAELLIFYEGEKQRAGTELEAAEDDRRRWQEANDVVSIDEQISSQLQILTAQERQLEESRATSELTLQQDPLVSRLQGDLMNAELALNDILQRYTPADRRVQEKHEQIDMLHQQIAAARARLRASVGSHETALREQMRRTSATLGELRRRKLEGDRLNRIVDLHRDTFLRYGRNLEETKIAAKLDQEQLSTVTIIERPHPTLRTDLRERVGFFLLAAIVGLMVGIVVAFALAFFNKSLRTRRDVETHLGLPVLASIPDLRSQPI